MFKTRVEWTRTSLFNNCVCTAYYNRIFSATSQVVPKQKLMIQFRTEDRSMKRNYILKISFFRDVTECILVYRSWRLRTRCNFQLRDQPTDQQTNQTKTPQLNYSCIGNPLLARTVELALRLTTDLVIWLWFLVR